MKTRISEPRARTPHLARAGTAVQYGSLTVPAAAERLVDRAFAYVGRDSVARALIERLERSPTPHRIVIDHHADDSYHPATHVIRWDPTSASRTSRGGHQSPALGLAHEIDHAVAGDYARLGRIGDRRFGNAEERRVILGSERHAARTLHESTRSDHIGHGYRVESPIDR